MESGARGLYCGLLETATCSKRNPHIADRRRGLGLRPNFVYLRCRVQVQAHNLRALIARAFHQPLGFEITDHFHAGEFQSTEIIPRWEWRTFAKTIDTRIDLATYRRTRHLQSSEIYLTSDTAQGNPRIRDEQIDIKILQQVNDDGLQQWTPVLKASFPLSTEQLLEVYRTLNVEATNVSEPCDFDKLLRMMQDGSNTRAVSVDKTRSQYDVDGCIVEMPEISFDGECFQTVAAENTDPGKVSAAVARLGLQDRENLSYVEAIRRLHAGTLS